MKKDLSFVQKSQKETRDIRRYEGEYYRVYDSKNFEKLTVQEIVHKIKPKNIIQLIALSNILYVRDRVEINFVYLFLKENGGL